MKCIKFVAALALASVMAVSAEAAPIFTQNFESDSTASWTVNPSTGANTTDTFTNFFFDYSTIGIPSAPNGTGTRGLKMYANHANGVFGGLSVSPTGLSIPGTKYVLKFDAWLNYNGAAAPGNGIGAGGDVTLPGGSGTTQAGSWGIMTSGTVSQWAGGTTDSMMFAATHDGGATQDYRVYPKGALAGVATGYYAAGTSTSPDARNDLHDYYNGIGGKSAPAAQLALYPQQFGTTRDGAIGFAWRRMEIARDGNIVTWTMDGLRLATVDLTTITGSFGGSNFFLGHFDTNAGSSADPNDTALLFTLIDNVSVQVPEPGAALLGLFGVAGLLAVRRRD